MYLIFKRAYFSFAIFAYHGLASFDEEMFPLNLTLFAIIAFIFTFFYYYELPHVHRYPYLLLTFPKNLSFSAIIFIFF